MELESGDILQVALLLKCVSNLELRLCPALGPCLPDSCCLLLGQIHSSCSPILFVQHCRRHSSTVFNVRATDSLVQF